MNDILLRIKSYEAHAFASFLSTQSEQSSNLVKLSFPVARAIWKTTKSCD